MSQTDANESIDAAQVRELAERLVAQIRREALRVSGVTLLAGDASTRRYVRVHLSGGSRDSLILMLLAGAAGPAGGGPRELTQDDTFVELADYFSRHDIPVPEVYVDARAENALLVEDIGDLALWHVAKRERLEVVEPRLGAVNDELVQNLFRKSIDIIHRLHQLPYEPECVAFERKVSFEKYRAEIAEILDYILVPAGIKESETEPMHEVFDAICESVCSHPAVMSHVDYMAHNIYIKEDGELCILDFQDASAISPVRDIVSLINDRDMDTALGKSMHQQLFCYFLDTVAGKKSAEREQVREYYNQYLFHWDCRVSGRFQLLVDRGSDRYEQWIAGTLRRLGRTLLRLEGLFPGIDDLLVILPKYRGEIREGIEDPWPLPE